jgi:hypothetical protein
MRRATGSDRPTSQRVSGDASKGSYPRSRDSSGVFLEGLKADAVRIDPDQRGQVGNAVVFGRSSSWRKALSMVSVVVACAFSCAIYEFRPVGLTASMDFR